MPDTTPDEPQQQNDPLHGVTLKAMVEALQEKLGWDGLAEKIHAKCFMYEPSVQSSLVFLRRTPWAREKLEKLYMWTFHRPYLHKKYREKKGFDGPAAGKPSGKPGSAPNQGTATGKPGPGSRGHGPASQGLSSRETDGAPGEPQVTARGLQKSPPGPEADERA